jgi:hypothetical protein
MAEKDLQLERYDEQTGVGGIFTFIASINLDSKQGWRS